uniref:Uncharacterized protein n=1 Tax=Balaenoptera musculus TaxID=9771 RepID=A0A8C0HT49_BALMU
MEGRAMARKAGRPPEETLLLWKRELWGGLPPWCPHRPVQHRGGQETPAGGRAGEQRSAQGEDTAPEGWRRLISSDGRFRDHPGHGAEEPRPQHQAPLCLCGPQNEPGGSRAPDPWLLQVSDSGGPAPG